MSASQADMPVVKQKPKNKEYVYAFATLRSMDGVELLQEAYKRYKKPHKRCCIKCCHVFWCRCCCKREYNRIKLREIDGVWPVI